MKTVFKLFIAFALTNTLIAPASAEDKPQEIRIAFSGAGTGGRPMGSGNVLATAHLQGVIDQEFKADGIKVHWDFFPGAGPATNESFANGLVDFAYHGDLPLIVGRSTGLKQKLLLSLGRFGNTYFVVPTDSEAKTLADLKGKRLATFKGTAGQLTLNRVLDKYGFSEKDFRVISMDTDTTKAALATRDIGGTIISPFDLQARGIAKTLFIIPRDPKITSVGTFWVSDEFEKKYPAIVQRIVTQLVKVAYWESQDQNRDKLFHLWAQSGSTPYTDWVQSWSGYTVKERESPLLDDYYQAAIKKSIAEAKKFHLTRSDVDFNGWLEPKYLNTALKQLNLEHYWTEDDAEGNPKAN